MKAQRRTLASVLAAGVVVTILLLTGLFWLRSLCGTLRYNWLQQASPELRVYLSDLLPWQRASLADHLTPDSIVIPKQADAPFLAGLGIMQYVQSRWPTKAGSHVYRWESDSDEERLYFDTTLGQMVYQGTQRVTNANGQAALAPFTYYAGPKGVGLSPEAKLGRFVDPIVDRARLRPWIVYDRALKRFFRIDWGDQTVEQGPELPKSGVHTPVQIGVLAKNSESFRLLFAAGSYHLRPGEEGAPRVSSPVLEVMSDATFLTDYTPVLDASGRIELLNVNTLEFAAHAVRLPAASSLYGANRTVTPEEVMAYRVMPISSRRPGAGGKWDDAGCVVAVLSRDGTSVRVEVFDPNGRGVAAADTQVTQYTETAKGEIVRRASVSSTQAAYFHLPGAYGLTLAKLALESLHPPVLLFLSYFPASRFEATAGYRSLLLLPDSFVAMKARDKSGWWGERFLVSMVFLIPALVLAALFAWRIARDGSRIGLSERERTAWIVGTVLFGPAAYFTYRVTRPRVVFVTCANCGVGRRPDRDQCHHCRSPWTVPELTPPAWRVLGEIERAEENSFSREPQADSQVQ